MLINDTKMKLDTSFNSANNRQCTWLNGCRQNRRNIAAAKLRTSRGPQKGSKLYDTMRDTVINSQQKLISATGRKVNNRGNSKRIISGKNQGR